MRRRYHRRKFRFLKILLTLVAIFFYVVYIFFERQFTDGINYIVMIKASKTLFQKTVVRKKRKKVTNTSIFFAFPDILQKENAADKKHLKPY